MGKCEQHGKTSCMFCGGPGICEHKTHKQRCVICAPASACRRYELDAIRFKREFKLSIADFVLIISQPCIYCGESKEQRGIDRWNNSVGYVLSNCLPCCKTCNMMKKGMGWHEFIQQARRIAERHKFM